MKYQVLRMIASCLWILSWVVIVVGVVISIIIGIGAATTIAKVGFLLGGFLITALIGLSLMSKSKRILLSINTEEDLRRIADSLDKIKKA